MKTYKLEITITEDSNLNVNSENDGFTPFELMGMLDWKKRDIENQIFGSIKPEVVLRKIIKD